MSADGRLIALAAGGTGGHLFPAEALAQEMKRRGWRVLLVTDARGARYTQNFPADETLQISAATPSIGGPIAKGIAALSITHGLITSMQRFRRSRPDIAVGFGGYPSLPAMKAAALMKIPYGVHEQNGVLGRANRLLVKGGEFTAHAFPVLEKLPAGATPIEVGNPVRDAVAAVAGAPYEPPLADGEIRLLIFGGSQGASIFSKTPVEVIAALPESLRRRLHVTHQAREGELATVRGAYEAAGVTHIVEPFFTDLPQRIAGAHLVLSRAGASTVTELSVIGRPSILVPLAIAMDDHQSGNARTLSEGDAAFLIKEQEFTVESLTHALTEVLPNPQKLAAMAAAARGRVKTGAAAALADLAEQAIAHKRAA